MRRRRSLVLWLVVAVALAAAAGVRLPGGQDERPDGSGSARGRAVRVVDGDTIKVHLRGRAETVRYIGVDTPESVKPGTPVQCYGHAASSANRRLVEGRDVDLRIGREPRDRYGRLLAYVYRASDHLFVNAELVERGYARTLTIPPNDAFAARFARLERAASAAGRGLWSACTP